MTNEMLPNPLYHLLFFFAALPSMENHTDRTPYGSTVPRKKATRPWSTGRRRIGFGDYQISKSCMCMSSFLSPCLHNAVLFE